MYSKLKTVLPNDHLIGKISLFLSVMAMFFAVSSGNTGCLYAEECSVGDSESFSNNIRLYTNSTNYHEITGDTNNPNTVDHTLLLPNKNGTLLSTAMNFGNNQFLKTDGNGDIISDDLPQLDLDDDAEFDVTGITSGKYLQTTATGLNFVDIDINETTFDSSNGSEGQILQISGGSLSWNDISGGGGSFQTTANQNIVPGAVGIESDGSVRNVDVQQNGVAQVNLSQAQTGGGATNVGWMSSHYNSNIDGQIVVYKDYDSNNQSSCDTHFYVDVVQENNGTLSNWGRQCISNSWGSHQTNGYSQYSNPSPQTQSYHYSFDRYGLEHDDSVNQYVFVYAGGSGNNSNAGDGQIWTVPIQINTSNNTLVVGTDSLLHDQHYCYSNGSCSSSQQQQYWVQAIHSNVYAQQTSDANRMWVFYKAYQGGYYSNAYAWYKSYTCNFTNSTSDSCSPYNNHAFDLATSNGTNYLKQNWYDGFNPVVWWDNLGQTFIVINRNAQNNSECRFAQIQIAENYNSGYNNYSGNIYKFTHGTYGYTDDISGGTFDTSGSNYTCGYSSQRPIHVPEHDNYIWVVSSGSTGQIDNYFLQIKSDTTSNQGSLVNAPVEVSKGSMENLITDEICVNTPNEECNAGLYNKNGDVHIDKSVSPYKYYWNNRGMQDRNLCSKDYQQSKCAEIYEWSFDSTTGILDSSTFTHYDYQNRDESYHNDPSRSLGIWKDNGSGIVFTLNAHSNQAIDSANNNLLHAIAFVIPDNISEYIGFVTQSANQGATVTVLSVGAVLELSGSNFTIGEEYYVQTDGSLSTSGTYKIGRAIATDKIYITDTR
jgi:hypothetical protein